MFPCSLNHVFVPLFPNLKLAMSLLCPKTPKWEGLTYSYGAFLVSKFKHVFRNSNIQFSY